MSENTVKIDWLKCHHGRELRSGCRDCEQEKLAALNNYTQMVKKLGEAPERIPIRKGCNNNICFCNGSCNQIVGYREPLYPGEK